MAIGFFVNGMPEFSIFCGFLVPSIGSCTSPRNMEPAASTVISTIPKTFTLSIRVSIRAQKPSPRFSGKTEVLVFVIPATRAITLDVAHGEPPIFLYALVSVTVAVGPMAYTFFVAPPIIPDSLIWRSIHWSIFPKGIISTSCCCAETAPQQSMADSIPNIRTFFWIISLINNWQSL